MKRLALLAAVAISTLTTSPLFAMARANTDPNAPQPPAWVTMVPYAAFGLVIYFMIFRPQAKQRSEREKFLSNLKKGDRVITQGGFVVSITNIGVKYVDVKLNDDTKAKIQRSGIVDVVPAGDLEKEAATAVPVATHE